MADRAGEWGVFAPNGRKDDYKWELLLALPAGVLVSRIRVRITDANSNLVTTPTTPDGEVWETKEFAYYPLVVFLADDATQVNSAYVNSLGNFGLTPHFFLYGQNRISVEQVGNYFTVDVYLSNGCVLHRIAYGICQSPETCPLEIPNPQGTKFKLRPGFVLEGTFNDVLSPPDVYQACGVIGDHGAGLLDSVPDWDLKMDEVGTQQCQWTSLKHYQNTIGPAPNACITYRVNTTSGRRGLFNADIGYICETCIAGSDGVSHYWLLTIAMLQNSTEEPFCAGNDMWRGKKEHGLTPAGRYTRIPGDCATGPATIDVESYA